MEHWQFLIQKQGDRTWHNLESPTLKILTGKYRVLARSPLANTDVEVRVTHSSIEDVPPKRRVFKRLRRTDGDGLMAVIPFTDLKPGIWEIRCSGDLMTDMLGQSWQHSLLLKVLPSEVPEQLLLGSSGLLDQEPEPDTINTPSATTSTTTPEDTIINQPVSPVLLRGETAEQILQNLIDLALPNTDSWDEDPQNEDVSPVSPPSPLEISLEKDTYIAQWGKTLTINGYAELINTEDPQDELLSEITTINIYQSQLVVELRSPLQSNILTQTKQPLTNQILPFTFSSIIQIPADCESKLILANINLYGSLTPDSEVKLLGSHPFIITADVTELLTVSARISKETSTPPTSLPEENSPPTEDVTTPPEPPVTLGLELFNIVKTPKLAQFRILKPSVKKPLPPKVKPLIPANGIAPTLPKLPQVRKHFIPSNAGNSDVKDSPFLGGVKKTANIPPINLEKLVIKQVKTSFPYLKRLIKPEPEPAPAPVPEIPLSIPENTLALLPSNEEPSNEEHNPDHQDEEVTALELRENLAVVIPEVPHLEIYDYADEVVTPKTPETSPLIKKWIDSQGYSLEAGIEIVYQDQEVQEAQPSQDDSASVAEELPNSEAEIEPVLELPEHLILDREPTPLPELELPEHLILDSEPIPLPEPPPTPPARLSQEIVLDDVEITSVNSVNEDKNQPPEPSLDLSPPVLTSLPTPQLFLPSGELLTGSAIKVRLELPQASSTVVIKLWVEDYQTRGLLDGPHLLQDLRPTPWGNWEATTQLIVPLGCLEVLIGAIALDVNSQQESHKVTMVKTVIPPNLPTVELDDVLDF